MLKFSQFLTTIILCTGLAKAQSINLWATTTIGGPSGYGTILKADSSGNNFTVVGNFNQANGSYPNGSLSIIANGTIYGTTRRGGLNDSCTIFSYDTATQTITIQYDFMSAPQSGALPTSGMLLGSDCIFYGLTEQGGAGGDGTIYSYDPVSGGYTDLYDFDIDSLGVRPQGELLELSNGLFYGVTGLSFSFEAVLFSFDPISSAYTVLHTFAIPTGNNPYYGKLIQATNGKLYGMASNGGANYDGVIFSYDIASQLYSVAYSFVDSTGSNPTGSLFQASDGKLYGMTRWGGTPGSHGTLFSYDIASAVYTKLADFNGINGDFNHSNGVNTARGVIQATNGKLYGVTPTGGIHDCGVIFSYDIQNNFYSKVLDFDTLITGAQPNCYIFETGGTPTNPCLVSIPNPIVENFDIYPNPSNGHFHLSGMTGNSELKICDITGRIVQNQTILNSEMELNLNFSKGLYIVEIENEKGFIRKRIVLN